MTETGSSRVNGLLAEMTLDEKAALTAGVNMWFGTGVERLGISPIKVSDGPAGVRGQRWVHSTAACTPCATALGSTWDPATVAAVAEVLAEECATKDVDVLLAPTVNLHRHPLAGRNFECLSEDPFLTATLAVAHIESLQRAGTGACIKHFVANDSEFERMSISSEVDEVALRELYLMPFERAVDAGVAAVMSAYNRLNGTSCSEHHWLLTELLKVEWGFEGAVISDWWGTYDGAAAEGGLDLEMPGPPIHLGPVLAERVRSGDLDEALVEDKARRILTTMDRFGGLDRPPRGAERSVDEPRHARVLRAAAADGIVLLRNDPVDGAPVLPLSPAVTKVAVIGPNADAHTMLGGGSASMNLHHAVTVLDGLRAALGPDVELVHEHGVDATRSAHPLPERWTDGIVVDYFANREWTGDPVYSATASDLRLVWMGDLPDGVPEGQFSVRAAATFVAPEDGTWKLSLVTGGAGRVRLDGAVVLDNFEHREPGTEFFGLGSAEITHEFRTSAGARHEVVADFECIEGLGVGALMVGLRPPVAPDGIERAAAAAAHADVAVVVIGMDQSWEGEGGNRADLSLPGRQAELVAAVSAANPRTVVLLNSGAVVSLDGTEAAPALVQTWYLGEEHGNAVADVLTGAIDPGGRLPMTWGRNVEDWSSHEGYPGADGKVTYGEGLLVGYRDFDAHDRDPAFCFGHGLSYGTSTWGDVSGLPESADAATLEAGIEIRVPLHNDGDRPVTEVVQCYVGAPGEFPGRPLRELRSFSKVRLNPGERSDAVLRLDRRSFSRWDPSSGSWSVMAGAHTVHLGRSSRDQLVELLVDVRE
jgi:beta-glucosidase